MNLIATKLIDTLTGNIIKFAGRRIKEAFLGTEKEQAIQKCVKAGLTAIKDEYLDEIPENRHTECLDFWGAYFNNPYVQQEMAALLRDEQPRLEELQYIFDEIVDSEHFTQPSLTELLKTFNTAFVTQTLEEKDLQGELQLTRLRQILDVSTEHLNVGKQQAKLLSDMNKKLDRLPDPEKKVAVARLNYLNWLNRFCQNLPLGALGLDSGLETEIQLEQVYIDLDTRTNAEYVKFDVPKRKKRRGLLSDYYPVPALTAFHNCPKLVLLGDPGSGKSTFVKMLCLKQIRVLEGLDKKPWTKVDPDLLPLFITLRDLVTPLNQLSEVPKKKESLQLLEREIERQLDEAKALDFKGELFQLLAAGKILLVMDGLDELPQKARHQVVTLVKNIIKDVGPKRIVLTCRIRSYTGETQLENFTHFTLAEFNDEQIKKFVHGWYKRLKAVGKYTSDEAEHQISDLTSAAHDKKMRDLAGNPMLLTTMAIIHQRDKRLPEQRVELYALAVDVLLRRWHGEKKIQISKRLQTEILNNTVRLREIMERLAYEAHCVKCDGNNEADLPRKEAVYILDNAQYIDDLGLVEEFLAYVDQRAGLLVGRGGDLKKPAVYSFPHRQFQEYLAGCYLIGLRDRVKQIRGKAADGDYWGEAVKLGLEELWYVRISKNECFELMYAFCREQTPATDQQQRVYLWGTHLATVAGVKKVTADTGGSTEGKDFLTNVRAGLPLIMRDVLTPIERADAGNALAVLGDHRPGIRDVDAMEFCWVPGGDFYMGDDRHDDQKRRQNPDLANDYWISRFPITNGQYQQFIAAGGYENADWWTKDGREWRQEKKITGLREYSSPYDLSNHPVVGVSWYEAAAFAKWLTEHYREKGFLETGEEIRLPGEAHWEKAARGGLAIPKSEVILKISEIDRGSKLAMNKNSLERRDYPWGDDEPEPNRVNFNKTNINTTSPVGCFPAGKGPYGTEEQSGNVWEWCEDKYSENTESRVLRGGAFFNNTGYLRCSYRDVSLGPGNRFNDGGFRLVRLSES